jgi:hypothetical protein
VAWSRVFSFSDPLACRAVIWSANCELFPTAKVSFGAELTQIGMNILWMHRIRVSLPQVNTVTVKPGRRAIGFLIEPNSSPLQHCGLEVMPGDIIVNGFDVTHQRSDANFHYGTMSLPLDDLDAAAEAIVGRCVECTSRIARCCAPTPRNQPSLALSLIMVFGSSAAFRSPIAHCLGSRHRRRCSALPSNWNFIRVRKRAHRGHSGATRPCVTFGAKRT